MALKIVNGKVVNVKPPRLTTGQVRKMEKTPTSKKVIERATSRKYNIVYK